MRLARFFLSGLILFHLFTVLVLPNRNSLLTKWAQRSFGPYQEFFEFSANWNFFAPDPGPPPLYLEWEKQGPNGEDLGTERFPETKDPFLFRDRQNRRIAIARFFHMYDAAYVRIWGDYVCHAQPEVNSIRLWRVVLAVPSMSEISEGKKTLQDFEVADRKSVGNLFCDRMGSQK